MAIPPEYCLLCVLEMELGRLLRWFDRVSVTIVLRWRQAFFWHVLGYLMMKIGGILMAMAVEFGCGFELLPERDVSAACSWFEVVFFWRDLGYLRKRIGRILTVMVVAVVVKFGSGFDL